MIFVHKVAKAIDFEFIRDEVAHLYCQDITRHIYQATMAQNIKKIAIVVWFFLYCF
ncbi:hypothetical protein ACWIW6_04100 [Ursidibacter sp. B-7004-1]